jgi:hypothetical protein
MEEFKPYESIKPGLMQWKCVLCNGSVYHKLVLHYKNQSQESIYIDNDFGEYMLCSTYRIDHQQRNEVTCGRNKIISLISTFPQNSYTLIDFGCGDGDIIEFFYPYNQDDTICHLKKYFIDYEKFIEQLRCFINRKA